MSGGESDPFTQRSLVPQPDPPSVTALQLGRRPVRTGSDLRYWLAVASIVNPSGRPRRPRNRPAPDNLPLRRDASAVETGAAEPVRLDHRRPHRVEIRAEQHVAAASSHHHKVVGTHLASSAIRFHSPASGSLPGVPHQTAAHRVRRPVTWPMSPHARKTARRPIPARGRRTSTEDASSAPAHGTRGPMRLVICSRPSMVEGSRPSMVEALRTEGPELPRHGARRSVPARPRSGSASRTFTTGGAWCEATSASVSGDVVEHRAPTLQIPATARADTTGLTQPSQPAMAVGTATAEASVRNSPAC